MTSTIGPIDNTVDTLKSGNEEDEIRGIATAFMPSYDVIQHAIARQFNLLIAHEAPYYHHRDQVEHLAGDIVYTAKKTLIDTSGIAIFRLHDYMHRQDPDTIANGLIKHLDWESYIEKQPIQTGLSFSVSQVIIPAMTAKSVATYVKEKMNLPFVRLVGNPFTACSRIGFLPGYRGSGDLVIPYFRNAGLDLIITGEGPEWEAPEYIYDAVCQGVNKAILILGHENSEASGMKTLAGSLQQHYPNIPVEYLSRNQVFQLI